jgi:hypothetical protein
MIQVLRCIWTLRTKKLQSLSGYIVSKGLEYSVDVSLMQQFYQGRKQRG